MIELIAIAALAAVGAYATLKGAFGAAAEAYAKTKEASVKLELAKLKVDAKAEIVKVVAAISSFACRLRTACAGVRRM